MVKIRWSGKTCCIAWYLHSYTSPLRLAVAQSMKCINIVTFYPKKMLHKCCYVLGATKTKCLSSCRLCVCVCVLLFSQKSFAFVSSRTIATVSYFLLTAVRAQVRIRFSSKWSIGMPLLTKLTCSLAYAQMRITCILMAKPKIFHFVPRKIEWKKQKPKTKTLSTWQLYRLGRLAFNYTVAVCSSINARRKWVYGLCLTSLLSHTYRYAPVNWYGSVGLVQLEMSTIIDLSSVECTMLFSGGSKTP